MRQLVVKQKSRPGLRDTTTTYFDSGDLYWYRGEGWYWRSSVTARCWFGPYATVRLAAAAKAEVKDYGSCTGMRAVMLWSGLCLVNALMLPYIVTLYIVSRAQRWFDPA